MQHSQQLCSIRQGSGHTRWQLKSYSRLPGLIQSIILTPLLCVHTLVLLKQSILFRITALSMKIPHAHRGPNPQLKLILLYISHNLVDSISMHTPYYSEIYMLNAVAGTSTTTIPESSKICSVATEISVMLCMNRNRISQYQRQNYLIPSPATHWLSKVHTVEVSL